MKAIMLLGCLLVAGCVEVTRFKDPAGDIYYAGCDDPIRLQSCRSALESTCPGGYDPIAAETTNVGGQMVPTKSGYFRCR